MMPRHGSDFELISRFGIPNMIMDEFGFAFKHCRA